MTESKLHTTPNRQLASTLSQGTLSVDKVSMAYVDNNNTAAPQTLLLLHGLFDHKDTWNHLTPHLDRDFRLVAPDLIGFGASDKPLLEHLPIEQRYTPLMQVKYLSELIAHLKLDNIILVGNSLGGGIALGLWLTYPELRAKIRGLVLICGAGYPQVLTPYIHLVRTGLTDLLFHPQLRRLRLHAYLLRRSLYTIYSRIFFDPDKIPPDQIEASIRALDSDNALYCYKMAARNLFPADHIQLVRRFGEFDRPAFVLWGKEDRIVPLWCGLRFEADLPHAHLHLIDRCGHAPHLEFPAKTADLIKAWSTANL